MTAIITESKIIELFCMAGVLYTFFDIMIAKYAFNSTTKRLRHSASAMAKAESTTIMIHRQYCCFRLFRYSLFFDAHRQPNDTVNSTACRLAQGYATLTQRTEAATLKRNAEAVHTTRMFCPGISLTICY